MPFDVCPSRRNLYSVVLYLQVPVGDYEVPLGVAKVVQTGKDITLVGWGGQVNVMKKAAAEAAALGISCEVIDLRTLLPWDRECVANSVSKTGRLIITHEAPVCGKLRITSSVLDNQVFVCFAENWRFCG